MSRMELQEAVSAAVRDAYRAGLTPQEIQDAVEFGAHDAGRLDQAILARDGRLIEAWEPPLVDDGPEAEEVEA